MGAALLSAGAGISGADDSHQVLYEAWGTPGVTTDSVAYIGDNESIGQDTPVTLPWSKSISATSSPVWYMSVQNTASAGGSVSCRITVDGVVKDQKTVDGFASIAECTVSP